MEKKKDLHERQRLSRNYFPWALSEHKLEH